MRCLKCGNSYEEKSGLLLINDDLIGPYSVADAQWKECPSCHRRLFTPQTLERMEEERQKQLDGLLRRQPVEDFISAAETAELLGISRQALHKHRRIRRGFIYQIRRYGKTEYLKKSVQLYKDTGDGRFPIARVDLEEPQYLSILTTTGTINVFRDCSETAAPPWRHNISQMNIYEEDSHAWQH